MTQPSRQTVAEDLPTIVSFLTALLPGMGDATLTDVVAQLKLATMNDAALGLVTAAVIAGEGQSQPEVRRRA